LRTAESGLAHATIAASHRRIRRLLGALQDLAGLSGPLPEHTMLAQASSRLGEVLLLHSADRGGGRRQRDAGDRASGPAGPTMLPEALRNAVARVGSFQIGSHGWWLAVHDVADLCGREPPCGSEAAWSADP
jgi:hypothetical protein